ncbi:MAG: EamA family transporter [bacterium]
MAPCQCSSGRCRLFFAQSWGNVNLAGWGGVVFPGLFSITFSYFIWNQSVLRVGPARTAIYSNLIPVVAVIAGIVFLA